MSRTFDDRLQWDLKNHRHGLLEAIIAGNPSSLDRVLDVIRLECDVLCRQAVEHFQKPQSTIAFAAQQRLMLRNNQGPPLTKPLPVTGAAILLWLVTLRGFAGWTSS